MFTRVSASTRWREYSPWIVAAAFTTSAPIHLVHPGAFASIVPDFLPSRVKLVYASGVVELVCAVGLWRRDRWAAIGGAALLVVIWPANLQGAITAQRGHDMTSQAIAWIRFLLQIPLIWCALQSGTTRCATGGCRRELSRRQNRGIRLVLRLCNRLLLSNEEREASDGT